MITASGKLTVFGQNNTDQNWALGHLSSDTSDRSFVGIEFKEENAGSVQFRARVFGPGGVGAEGATLSLPNGDYNFEDTYNPNQSSNGRLTVRIFNGTYDQTSVVDLSASVRASGAALDAFGPGIMAGVASTDDPNRTVQMFIDDVSYSGFQQLSTVTVSATDSAAAEQASDTGTFTFTRTGTSGNLVVNYSINGTASGGSDYSALSGSVTISSGQSSAMVTVTPIDDAAVEGSETVILTISSSANYTVRTPSSATVTIADNDVAATDADFTTNPKWTAVGNTTGGHNYGYSGSTSNAGGSTGEIGGTFVRSSTESYYADTNLSQTFDLDDVITASGKVTVFGQVNTDGDWILGHISSSTSDRSTVGIEFLEYDSSAVRFRAKLEQPGGGGSTSDNTVVLPKRRLRLRVLLRSKPGQLRARDGPHVQRFLRRNGLP